MQPNFRCWAEIDLQALRENLAWIRHAVGPSIKIITVVKADAYGHGLRQIAALLMQSGTDVFGVANLAEAQAIRSVGPGWPILMLGACLPHETELAVRESVMPTISSFEEARRFSRVAVRFKRVVPFHLKIDTGMGRLGVVADQALNLIQSIRKLSGLNCVGLYTHFASAEDDAEFCASQRQQFQSIVESTLAPLPGVQYIHAHNSAGLLFERPSVFNCVRPGLLVYGILPEARRKLPVLWRRRIRPALSWKTRVGLIKEIAGGSSISYGRTFVAARAMRIAIITAGYGDGYLRSGSNRAQVLVRGHRCPVLGRITMDQMVVDVSHLPRVRVGDEVVLLGKQGREEISAVELAVWQSTIPWEVLTNITYRVPRLYRGAQAA